MRQFSVEDVGLHFLLLLALLLTMLLTMLLAIRLPVASLLGSRYSQPLLNLTFTLYASLGWAQSTLASYGVGLYFL